ncbi:hypothetical protein WN944_009484 [Citrus x changshan-huyou]|uniref:F-box associated beta-propeller type 1 domain-containing protein n=1 Tax=Citrus x changshan-huyou TaxID=2935761 RepID=A0AAP0MSA9_9ROSI
MALITTPRKDPYLEVLIRGSCIGLLCLSTLDETGGEPLFIYNCSTREFTRIPSYEPLDNGRCRSSSTLGIGYAQSIDDLKVFGVSRCDEDRLECVHVFSLRNNTWKTFEPNWDDFLACDWAIPLNGTIHFGFVSSRTRLRWLLHLILRKTSSDSYTYLMWIPIFIP